MFLSGFFLSVQLIELPLQFFKKEKKNHNKIQWQPTE